MSSILPSSRRRAAALSVLVAALVGGLALVAMSADAARFKTVNVTGTAKARNIEGETAAGTTTGNLGKGAVVFTTKAGANNTFTGTFTVYDARGSYSGTTEGTLTLPANETDPAQVSGTITTKRGTGRYRGATGKGTIEGTTTRDGLITLNTKGTLRMRR
jgi:hypothetical protein